MVYDWSKPLPTCLPKAFRKERSSRTSANQLWATHLHYSCGTYSLDRPLYMRSVADVYKRTSENWICFVASSGLCNVAVVNEPFAGLNYKKWTNELELFGIPNSFGYAPSECFPDQETPALVGNLSNQFLPLDAFPLLPLYSNLMCSCDF